MSTETAVLGIGETAFTRGTERSSRQLVLEAAASACTDAGLAPGDIDGVVLPQVGAAVSPAVLTESLALGDLQFQASVGMGGAGPTAAVWLAAQAVQAGWAERVLVTAGGAAYTDMRRRRSGATATWRDPRDDIRSLLENPYGLNRPVQWYALHANRWRWETKASWSGLREIAVTSRQHANLTPSAYFHDTPLTADQYDEAPVLVEPFRLYDICLQSDGACAVVVGRAGEEAAHAPVHVLGGAHASPPAATSMWARPDVTAMGVAPAAPRALAAAGVDLGDVDFAQLYDCFTFIVLRQLEELGFCKRGEGPDFVAGGRIRVGGELPVNTHGGLLSHAHVAGLNHVVEAVRQLRHEAGGRQVGDAEIGLVTGYGDFAEGSVLVLGAGR